MDRVKKFSEANPPDTPDHGSVMNIFNAISTETMQTELPSATNMEQYYNQSNNNNRPYVNYAAEHLEPDVRWRTYQNYFLKGGGGYITLLCCLGLSILAEAVFSGSNIWVEIWTSNNSSANNTTQREEVLGILDGFSSNTNLYIFVALCGVLILVSLVTAWNFYKMCLRSTEVLHDDMFVKVLRASSAFYDHNSVGRILARFTKDLEAIDEILPSVMLDVITVSCCSNAIYLLHHPLTFISFPLQSFGMVYGILVITVFYQSWFGIPAAFVLGLVFFLKLYFLSSALTTRRIERLSHVPVLNQLSTSLLGLTTLRASRAEQQLIERFDKFQVKIKEMCYFFHSSIE